LVGIAALILAGCSEGTEDRDGDVIERIALPTDVVLDLYCVDVGVFPEPCVLEDPANPFAKVPITEFDINNPDAPFNKRRLAAGLPVGPTGAKARFYLWATALARTPSGENQYRTALALHELFDANSNVLSEDELMRTQALKAYESVLVNFFGSAEVLTCRVVDGCDPPVNFFILLNEKVADNLYRTEATDFRRLVPGIQLEVIELLIDWGFAYRPCTDLPDCTNGLVSVIEG
jgi:hypothetical protein